MSEKTNKKVIGMESERFSKKEDFVNKTDGVLSVIKNINRHGGIVTQLQMAAVCIEVQKYVYILQDITHSEEREKRLIGINQTLSDIDKYIRSFKDVQHDLICSEESKQREEELDIIKDLKERFFDGNESCDLRQDDCKNLDSWAGLQTEIPILWRILYDSINNVISELDSLYYMIKTENPSGMELW